VDIPINAAENVEGFEAKGILISPMYINIKSLGDLWVIPPYATCDLYKKLNKYYDIFKSILGGYKYK
jgi:hypothetical protein